MSEPLLHMHYVLSVFQEMSGRTVPKVVDCDGMVECDPGKGVLENDTHIAWSDALWLFVVAMTLEDIVVARILLAICFEHDEHLLLGEPLGSLFGLRTRGSTSPLGSL